MTIVVFLPRRGATLGVHFLALVISRVNSIHVALIVRNQASDSLTFFRPESIDYHSSRLVVRID